MLRVFHNKLLRAWTHEVSPVTQPAFLHANGTYGLLITQLKSWPHYPFEQMLQSSAATCRAPCKAVAVACPAASASTHPLSRTRPAWDRCSPTTRSCVPRYLLQPGPSAAAASRVQPSALPDGPEAAASAVDIATPGKAPDASQEDINELELQLDTMAQEAWRLNNALATSRQTSAELAARLAVAEDQLAALQQDAAERADLTMAYDKLCQDFYKLRMSLQLAQESRGDVAADAQVAVAQLRANMAWQARDHQSALAAAHREQQLLATEVRQLRLKLLETEQQMWAAGVDRERPAGSSPAAANVPTDSSTSPAPQQGLQLQQEQQLGGPSSDAGQATAGQPGAPSSSQASTADLQLVVQQQVAQVEALRSQLQAVEGERAGLSAQVTALSREAALRELELEDLRQQLQQVQAAARAAQAPLSPDSGAETGELGRMEADVVHRLQQAEAEQRSLEAKLAAAQQQLEQLQRAPPAPLGDTGASAVAARVGLTLEVKQQLAQARVDVGNARRDTAAALQRATAAEAALAAAEQQHKAALADLRRWYGARVAVSAALRSGRALPTDLVGFTNTQRFWLPSSLLYEFLKRWVEREAALVEVRGFLGLKVTPQPGAGGGAGEGLDVVVVSSWSSVPDWEAWSLGDTARRLHLPNGTLQYVPAKGEGFPEDFIPFRQYDTAVNAKY